MRFTFWLFDCHDRFEGVLKQVCVYEAIEVSCFKQPLDLNFLKAFIARWSPHNNTVLTWYRELDISLWDVFWITGFPILGEMYSDFFVNNKLIMD